MDNTVQVSGSGHLSPIEVVDVERWRIRFKYICGETLSLKEQKRLRALDRAWRRLRVK